MSDRRKLRYGDLVEVKDSEVWINGSNRPRIHKYGRGIVIQGESEVSEDVVLVAFRCGVLCDIMDVADLECVGHVENVRETLMATIKDVTRGYGIRSEILKDIGNELTVRYVFPKESNEK